MNNHINCLATVSTELNLSVKVSLLAPLSGRQWHAVSVSGACVPCMRARHPLCHSPRVFEFFHCRDDSEVSETTGSESYEV